MTTQTKPTIEVDGLTFNTRQILDLGDAIFEHILDKFDYDFDALLADQVSQREDETEDEFFERYNQALGTAQALVLQAIFNADPTIQAALAAANVR